MFLGDKFADGVSIGISESGKIGKLGRTAPSNVKAIDAKGCLVLPGMIDCHVHLREPGLTHKEDFYTGTCAAAAGGVTTVIDMPNTVPKTETVEALLEKMKLAEGRAVVNAGFHFGGGASCGELEKMNGEALGAKFYLSETFNARGPADDEIAEKMRILAGKRLPACLHSERPEETSMAMKAHGKAHLCHVSKREDVNVAGALGTCEVTPHHLFLTEGSAKTSPALCSKPERAWLLEALLDGRIDCVASDHAPHLPDDGAPGVPGLETTLPLLFSKKVPVGRIVSATSLAPARVFGLEGRKGKIAEGHDADLVIFDQKKEWRVNGENLLTKCGWSPFEGWKLKGKIKTTIVNGSIVFDEGAGIVEKQGGRIITTQK